MQLWIGLGNPGPEYALHRHNVGFIAVDEIAEKYGFALPSRKFQGWLRKGKIGEYSVLLLKPATFMNESGRSVRLALDFFKLRSSDVTVFYDELDLAAMKVKVKGGGGAAGHNGMRSMIAHIGEDFRRVRIGIGRPEVHLVGGNAKNRNRITSHVLGNFRKTEMESLSNLLTAISAESIWLACGDDVRFMNDVALRLQQA